MKKVIYLLGIMLLMAGVAILPGESEVIKVTYRTNRAGNINKTVTVTSNAVKNSTVVLRIKGRVLEQPSEVLPANNNGMGAPVNKQ